MNDFEVKTYTKDEILEVLREGTDDLNDLILVSYFDVIDRKAFTGMVPDVMEVYNNFLSKFSSGAWKSILGCGDATEYITAHTIANFLMKNKLYSKWGMLYIRNPMMSFRFKDTQDSKDLVKELFG